jgi:hypothetical protein
LLAAGAAAAGRTTLFFSAHRKTSFNSSVESLLAEPLVPAVLSIASPDPGAVPQDHDNGRYGDRQNEQHCLQRPRPAVRSDAKNPFDEVHSVLPEIANQTRSAAASLAFVARH